MNYSVNIKLCIELETYVDVEADDIDDAFVVIGDIDLTDEIINAIKKNGFDIKGLDVLNVEPGELPYLYKEF